MAEEKKKEFDTIVVPEKPAVATPTVPVVTSPSWSWAEEAHIKYRPGYMPGHDGCGAKHPIPPDHK